MFAYGWGRNVDSDVANYDYTLNEDGSLTYRCVPNDYFDTQIRQLIIDGFFARMDEADLVGATSQYMLDMAYAAGVDEECHTSFCIRHETKGFTFTFRAEPNVNFDFDEKDEVVAIAHSPFEGEEMSNAYGRGCADYITANREICLAQAEITREEEVAKRRKQFERAVQDHTWVDEYSVRMIKGFKYAVMIPWILFHLGAAWWGLDLFFPEPADFWLLNWQTVKFLSFLLALCVSASIPSYVSNRRIAVVNYLHTENWRKTLLEVGPEHQLLASDKGFLETLDAEDDLNRYWTLRKIILALTINVCSILLAAYLFDTYVWFNSLFERLL
ncbi:hypothetical protein QGN29_05910 [Temperatibacter marinus]|uniref:Uncharacterized protein n=1 Tax=Temperatibacter marinus TaxID=1456591 RepID=A0AA52HA59_9PROT|nr:hypothetical protein [Temperatibacter marinus]WND03906.1 hypothetical protein QGN29_05910 [Temperatibacter marinus]